MKKQMTDLAVRDKQKHQDNITRTKASFCMRSGWMRVFVLWKLKNNSSRRAARRRKSSGSTWRWFGHAWAFMNCCRPWFTGFALSRLTIQTTPLNMLAMILMWIYIYIYIAHSESWSTTGGGLCPQSGFVPGKTKNGGGGVPIAAVEKKDLIAFLFYFQGPLCLFAGL